MKDKRNARKSCRARYNQARKHFQLALAILQMDPDKVEPGDIDDLRTAAGDALQCVHEFSAYWNVVHTD